MNDLSTLRRVVRRVAVVGSLLLVWLIPVTADAQTTEIFPGQDIQSVVNTRPPGTVFVLKAGIHRMQSIRPRTGDTFMGEPGTVLSGARLPTFVRSGNYYVATAQTQQGVQGHGECQPEHPRCTFPEELFINGERLQQVGSLAQVKPPNWAVERGQWYFDYNANSIYISYPPAGLRIETSVTPTAFQPTGDNVTITGLTIEMYANIAQQGAIHAQGRTGWTITRNEVRKNHGAGITAGTRGRVRENYVNNNGQIGIIGYGDDLLVESNQIFHNNTAGYFQKWEGGGAKFVGTRNLVVRNNFSHLNDGPGLWTDQDNINTLYENNTIDDNTWMGILHEISYSAIIRNNVVRRNGLGFPPWIVGAGILVTGSPDVEIYGNVLDGNADGIGAAQQNRGSGLYGPHQIWNLWVHDNVVANTPGWTGLAQDTGDNSVFTSRNNRFEHNRYTLGTTVYPFTWMNRELTEAQWKAFGQDLNGTFSR